MIDDLYLSSSKLVGVSISTPQNINSPVRNMFTRNRLTDDDFIAVNGQLKRSRRFGLHSVGVSCSSSAHWAAE